MKKDNQTSKRILILCTGNSCRSQMAEGFLKSFDERLAVFSAGTQPSLEVHPLAIQVMAEVGIDISQNRPQHVDQYLDEPFDFVITVCDHARENCPVFHGETGEQLHIGFDDPAAARGSRSEILAEFRRVRDEIWQAFRQFYNSRIAG
ncbi:MAG: arsenate reductase ArsC [Calditrichia bacterium]